MDPTPHVHEQATNRYLEGAFAPVLKETTALDLPVVGRVPRELNGRYLRNGPNPMRPDAASYHWFLGDGMLHGIRLREGRAEWYRNRWVRSRAVAEALGEAWPRGPVHDSDFAANTHVIAHAGRILATVEAGPLPYEMSADLDTVGPCDFDGALRGGFAAHTKLDPRSGELHAIAYSYRADSVQHVVVDRNGALIRAVDIPVRGKPMMHDFALTERYLVLYELPVGFNLPAAMSGARLPYAWNPDHEARIGVLRRDGGADDIRWFGVEPCFVFHTLNGYEDGDRIVVDVCRYEGAYDLATLTAANPAALDRWSIDLAAGTVSQQRLHDRSQEFPRVDERRIGRHHRYGYTAVIDELGSGGGDGSPSVLLKHDLQAGTAQAHDFGPDLAPGEAVFVPRAPDAPEDDGYVLALTRSRSGAPSELVILAAQDFTGEPVARVCLPDRVPLGLHGSWVPEALH